MDIQEQIKQELKRVMSVLGQEVSDAEIVLSTISKLANLAF